MSVDIEDKQNLVNQIRRIAKDVVKEWKQIDVNDIRVKEVSGGMTNMLYQASIPQSEGAKTEANYVLVRIYGNKTDLIIDRKQELENVKRLYAAGYGPKIYGTFQNGYVYEYYQGRSVSGEELYTCTWNAKLAAELARWHKQEITAQNPAVWNTIENWLGLIPESYGNPAKDAILSRLGGLKKIREELQEVKEMVAKLNSPIVFSHNDLLGGNIIVNESTGEIKFIDFEYAGANYQAFDIANHFNEWAGFEADYSRYPKKEQQYEFYKSYLKCFNGVEPTESELHDLYVQVNKFALVSHFFWGSWALVQGAISQIDFDFVAYAELRFAEYFNKKNEFFNLK